MTIIDTDKRTRFRKILRWLKKRLVPLAGLLGALAIIITVGWLYLQNRDIFDRLQNYSYGGAFVISVILNATVIIPVSNMAIMTALGATSPCPWLIGLAGGIGAAIGEMTGYIVGRSGRDLLARNKMYARVEGWVKRWGFIAVLILSIFPLLFDVVGIIAGAARMPWWRFFLASWLGRTISYVAVAYSGKAILNAFPWFG